MGKNRAFNVINLARLFVKMQVSVLELALVKISDDKQTFQRIQSAITSGILDRKENELQTVDAKFDGDITTEMRMEMMNMRKDIENKYQNELDAQLAQVQANEKFYDQKQQRVEQQIEVCRADAESYDEFMDSVDCSYMT